ncbi:hypothetical protein MMC22_004005 [Lobaria immixta]|nr:hypothetical protein [Lobaria immixta]
MAAFEETYQAACDSGLLPGIVLLAASRSGKFNYAKKIGVRSLKDGQSTQPMELDTVLGIASCTKLMTAISALQCVERGLLVLDEDVSRLLPEIGKYGIITSFDDATAQPIVSQKKNHITLRHLLSHTSGHEYDWSSPLLQKWRASRGETLFSGPTIADKSTLPLLFEPGTSWAYGAGLDWTGKMIEIVTGETLETYMSKNIWEPLGIKDITFWPKERADMKHKMADLSTISPESGKAVDAPDFDLVFGAIECLGGGGVFASSEAYMALLQAVLREDPRLLKPQSYGELFKPQLNEECENAFCNLLSSNQQMQEYLGINVPTTGRKNFSFAGMLSMDDYPGWMNKGTLLWGGVPNIIWVCLHLMVLSDLRVINELQFIDREAGLCGFAGCQILPPMTPRILKLHEQFQHEIYKLHAAT